MVSLNEIGDQGRKVIIITEFDLIHDNGIVFIDDRDNPQFEECQSRVPGIEEPPAVAQVIMGEKDLGNHLLMA